MRSLKIIFVNINCHDLDTVHCLKPQRRMKEVWIDKGDNNEERRREWEKRWRDARDIMTEEDVMETSIMHLCIPDPVKKEVYGILYPSECSYDALTVLLNQFLYKRIPCHFGMNQPGQRILVRPVSRPLARP